MRTTLTLDDDLGAILKRRAEALGLSFRQVLNDTLRAGLAADIGPSLANAPKTIPHAFGFRVGIDLDKLNQLVDDLSVEEFVEKLQRGEA